MRIIVMFDLPVVTSGEKREYRKFRSYLIKNGFLMLQESVYSKLALNGTVQKIITKKLEQNKPKKGSVVVLQVTETQYQSMIYLVGEKHTDVLDTTDRYVEL